MVHSVYGQALPRNNCHLFVVNLDNEFHTYFKKYSLQKPTCFIIIMTVFVNKK